MKKPNFPALITSLAAVCILISPWFSAPEEQVIPVTGWQTENGQHYYIYEDGSTPSGWTILDDQQYYFLNDGIAATGWFNLDDQRYFFHNDGTLATGWMKLAGMHYYFREDGSLVTGWYTIGKQQFYFGDHGAAAFGPARINGEIFLFDDTGALADGIFHYDGHTYQSNANGRPLAGWAASGSTSYYFDENGCAVTGWQTIDSLKYYFHHDGTPAAGITSLDGKTYHFASSGLYTPLVNPWNYLPDDYTPELTKINANHSVATIAYDDYMDMITALRADGQRAAVCSSFRTQDYQQMLFDRKMYYYTALGYEKAEAIVLAGQSVAVPGTSEHQLGLALDIVDTSNWSLNDSQAETPAQQWLIEHSWEYGWILRYPDGKSDITGIIYEPWHYRYVGRQVAAEIHELGLCLEEYLEMLTIG